VLLTIVQAAERLGVPVSTLRFWRATRHRNVPRPVKVGRLLRYRSEEIDRYLTPCCAEKLCDHVFCGECGEWAKDSGDGPKCHPRMTGR
jgi:excisionase family DNA binding protein